MAVIALDLGGTKLSSAILSEDGCVLKERIVTLGNRRGEEVGDLVVSGTEELFGDNSPGKEKITGIGICVPGIYHAGPGRVWAPNIEGWSDYPLKDRLESAFADKCNHIAVDSDRACSILGEAWKGAARNCSHAIYMAVGTGIGAGIMCDGRIIRGTADIAGAIGWMALTPVFRENYASCGCFEYHASGHGMVKAANELIPGKAAFTSASGIFEACGKGNAAAERILDEAVVYWGMAAANLVSIFNPEVVIFGGGIFGPASLLIDRIRQEAEKWAQPVSIKQARFELSLLGGKAGLLGAGKLALMGEET